MNSQNKELSFRISSGLKNLIGRDLISDRYIAVFELVKNSYDAGASKATISFEQSDDGTKRIIISDNGCGIEREQIPLAFLRHSTSKIKSVEDLFTVTSLGFRGEALSSIAAVSQVELITKTNGDFTGYR